MSEIAVAPRPAVAAKASPRREQLVLGIVGTLTFLVAWEVASRLELINPVVVSNPSRIAAAFVAQLQSGEILADLKVSLIEFAAGFGLSLLVGIGLGIAMGLSKLTEYAIDPFVWFLYSSPLIAFYPLIIVWLGFGFATVVAITFLLSFVSIVVNTLAGVQGVDPQLVRAVRAFGGSRLDVIRKVILPAAVPMIIAGMRIGLGRALHGVVLGEMFSSNAGLGYRITFYAAHLRTADVFVPLSILVVIGLFINALGNRMEARLQAWRS
ncbi:MAG TPA: ABC transporter permease [Xanthobacteraceae bacterium]|jgi:NitT/TauT family transport system permease protein|nr:ABC transporter permease [Xanthobacteraceae bacterium]